MGKRGQRKKPGAGSKYTGLREHPVLARWLANLGRGSQLTADVAVRRLGKACELLGVSPDGLLDKARRDLLGLQDALEDLVTELEKEHMSPGYIEGLLKVVKSLLRYHGVVLPRKIKISNLGATPTIDEEQVPTQEELSRIFRASPPRVRAAEALIAFAGLRIEAVSNFDGSDGLRLKDLPELKVQGRGVVFERTPAMVVVRATLSKRRRKYFTFLSGEGCTYLIEYLEGRIRRGERLGPNSPVIVYEKERQGYTPTTEFLKTAKVSRLIRQYMRKAGVQKRPYVLRAYADTQFMIAESKGKTPHAYVQFFMGHKGDIEARYSTEKGRLTPDMIEDMRKCYRNCEQFLSTVAKHLEQSDIVKEAKVEALKTMAKSLLGIDLVEVKVAKERALKRELSRDEELELFENELKKLREGEHNPQRIVGEDELESHLAGGWQFVSVLPSQKILIRKA